MLTVFIFRELNHPGQRRRLELQKSNWFRLTKQKPLHVYHTVFLHFFAVTAQLRGETA